MDVPPLQKCSKEAHISKPWHRAWSVCGSYFCCDCSAICRSTISAFGIPLGIHGIACASRCNSDRSGVNGALVLSKLWVTCSLIPENTSYFLLLRMRGTKENILLHTKQLALRFFFFFFRCMPVMATLFFVSLKIIKWTYTIHRHIFLT